MHWQHMTGWGWTMMILWSATWIALLAVIAWGIVHRATGGRAAGSPQPPAPDTAREQRGRASSSRTSA